MYITTSYLSAYLPHHLVLLYWHSLRVGSQRRTETLHFGSFERLLGSASGARALFDDTSPLLRLSHWSLRGHYRTISLTCSNASPTLLTIPSTQKLCEWCFFNCKLPVRLFIPRRSSVTNLTLRPICCASLL
jgi:hypothetical protein